MSALNFAQRTQAFWDWFSANEAKISEAAQNCGGPTEEERESLVAFISDGVALLSEDLRFNIGGDHEFTFAITAKTALFFLLPYVTAQLPEAFREKWTFSPGMPSCAGKKFGFRMHGTDVSNDEVMIAATPDSENGTAALRFYAKAWESLEDNPCYNAFYTLMEITIGEALANICIGNVERADAPTEDMFPLTQLEPWLLETLCKDGKAPDPAERYFGYEKKPQESSGLREDIFVGFSNYTALLSDYDNDDRETYEDFAGFGAKPVFLYYYPGDDDRRAFLDERNALMDALEAEVLGERGSGREIGLILGGAMGERRVYIDLLLYDEAAFLERARAFLTSVHTTPRMIFGKEFARDGQGFLLTDASVPGFSGRLQQLHEVDEHEEIARILEALPPEQMDFDLTNLYARALNNLYREKDALAVMESVRAQGENNALWNWRYGFALYHTKRVAESIPYLQKAIALGDDDEETASLLEEAQAQQEKDGD